MMLITDFFGIFYGENEALIIIEYQETPISKRTEAR